MPTRRGTPDDAGGDAKPLSRNTGYYMGHDNRSLMQPSNVLRQRHSGWWSSGVARGLAKSKGVFCLETDQWYGQKDRASVEPALQLLERYRDIPYQHRDVATEGEFRFFLDKYFQPGYKTHPILYLGFHGCGPEDGEDAFVQIGDGTQVSLETLEEWIDSRCHGRVIHFGSCGVMDAHGTRLNRFIRNTRALAIMGYREKVDWLESAAFEVLLVGRLQRAAFMKSSIEKFDRDLKQMAPGLYDRLGFRIVVTD